jgi:hypothetical protein
VECYQSQLPPLCNEFGPILDDPAFLGTEVWWDLGASREARPPAELMPRRGTARTVVDEGPFLSVLLRTQGQRPEQLAEALSGLASQTEASFEVLLLCHDVTPTQLNAVEKLVAEQPAELASRTRIVGVSGGLRGRPLNAGALAARGRYVAVLDDDDFALPGWVAGFARLAAAHPGFIARTGVRPVRRIDDQWEDSGGFPADFDLVDHLVGNRTPVCGLAFPRSAFSEFGLTFDEELPVLEDWDFLLRAGPLCGVASSAEVTSVYRQWDQADDSQSQHSPAEFAVAGRAVIEGVDEVPLLLPPGAVSAVRRDRMAVQSAAEAIDSARSEHEGEVARLRAHHDAELSQVRAEAMANLRALGAEIADVRSSTSWRLTAPMRGVGAMWLGLRRRLAREARPAETVAATASTTTWPVSYFDDLYAASPDPWGFETKWYERRKYQITLAALPLDRYRRAYEPGCSIGVLTELLASRCDFLIASDFAPAAIAAARRRVGHLPGVEVRSLASPREWPGGTFDLIVVSELAAYFDDADLTLLVRQVARSLDAGGHLVLVHFRPQGETPQSAEGIHAAFKAGAAFVSVASHVEPEFLLDVYARTELPGP